MKEKGFTLIELIAVLVITSILALIITPLVMNIIRKSKIVSDRRSVDYYGKSIELAISSYVMKNEKFPNSLEDLEIEYKGDEVNCNIKQMDDDYNVYLSECTVKNREVRDDKNEDGWYHYDPRIIKEDNLQFKVGDVVKYRGMNFYVIENSKKTDNTVSLLKANPLVVDDSLYYGSYIEYEITNSMRKYYAPNQYPSTPDTDDYLHIGYLFGDKCSYNDNYENCDLRYENSDIKKLIDFWVEKNLDIKDLEKDETGFSARLITIEELQENLGYVISIRGTDKRLIRRETPSFVYSKNYSYWTMSASETEYNSLMWCVSSSQITPWTPSSNSPVIRPVINLKKAALD